LTFFWRIFRLHPLQQSRLKLSLITKQVFLFASSQRILQFIPVFHRLLFPPLCSSLLGIQIWLFGVKHIFLLENQIGWFFTPGANPSRGVRFGQQQPSRTSLVSILVLVFWSPYFFNSIFFWTSFFGCNFCIFYRIRWPSLGPFSRFGWFF